MTGDARRLALALWAGLAVLIAGRLFDLRWHATHDGFETAADQLRAHWLAWLGTLILLAAALLADRAGHRGTAVVAVITGAALYGVVAVWHFYEHSQHRDPDLPHVLVAISQAVMIGATPVAALLLRRRTASRRWLRP